MLIKNSQSNGVDPKRRVMYRNYHNIKMAKHLIMDMQRKRRRAFHVQEPPNIQTHLVEIASSQDKKNVFIIMFPHFDDTQVYMKECLPIKLFNKLLNDNEGLFSNLINNNLEIRYGRIWVWGYHG